MHAFYTNFSITTPEFLIFPVNLSLSFLPLVFFIRHAASVLYCMARSSSMFVEYAAAVAVTVELLELVCSVS